MRREDEGLVQDGRVLGASQVEYKPFGKPPLKRELPSKSCNLESAPVLHPSAVVALRHEPLTPEVRSGPSQALISRP